MQVVWSYANQRRAVMRMISPTHIRVTLAGIGIAAAAVSVTPLAPAQAAATDGHGAALRPAAATEIPLAHLPRSIAADPLTGMIYVSEFGGELQVINGRTNSVVASLPAPGRVPLHAGYPAHPQNCAPALFPLRAVRSTIGVPHNGQSGRRR